MDYRDLAPDVLIIGSGPAGLFCAGQLREAGAGNILVIEQGKAMRRRTCPDSALCDCRPCDVLEGEGGAGSFSDGKITLSATRGTHGQELFTPQQASMLGRVEQIIRQFAPAIADYPQIGNLAALRGHEDTGLTFSSYPLIHLGSDGIRDFGRAYAAHLRQAGVHIATGTQATELLADDGQVAGVVVRDRHSRANTVIPASRVVAACGLAGAAWLEDQLRQAGVQLQTGPADFGIRLETTAAALSHLHRGVLRLQARPPRRRDRAAQLLRQRRRLHRRRISSRPGHPRRQRSLLPEPQKRPVQPRHRRHHHPGAPCRPQSLRPPARRNGQRRRRRLPHPAAAGRSAARLPAAGRGPGHGPENTARPPPGRPARRPAGRVPRLHRGARPGRARRARR